MPIESQSSFRRTPAPHSKPHDKAKPKRSAPLRPKRNLNSALSPSRGVPGAAAGIPTDPRYVASLKEQIQFLELECKVLKDSHQRHQKPLRSPSSTSRRVQSPVTRAATPHSSTSWSEFGGSHGLGDSLLELNERYRLLEEDHRKELEQRDADTLKLEQRLSEAQAAASSVDERIRLIQARSDEFIDAHSQEMEKKYQTLAAKLQNNSNNTELVKVLEGQLKAMEEATHKERQQWKAEEAAVKEDHVRLEEELAFAQERLKELEGSCGVDRKRLEDLEALHQTFQQEQASAEAKAAAAQAAEETMRKELAFSRATLAKAQDNERTLQDENKQLIEANAELTEQLRQVRQKLAEFASRQAEAESKCEQALVRAHTQQVQTDTANKRLEIFEAHLEKETARHKEDSILIAKERAQNVELGQKLDLCQTDLKLARTKQKQAQQHATRLVTDVASLDSKLKFVQVELERAREEATRALRAQAWAEEQYQKLAEHAEIHKELENLNLGELRNVMETNLQLASQFDSFLKKHQGSKTFEREFKSQQS